MTAHAPIAGVAMVIDGEWRSLPKPARHHDLIARYPMPEHTHGEQGFVTEDGLFLERRRAASVALHHQQTDKLKWPPLLYSEDLW